MTGGDTDVYDQLRQLEESLWRAQTRFDREYMEKILGPDFFEFGRSGRIYNREETLGVPAQEIAAVLPLPKFEVRLIDTNVALVTYISEVCYGKIKELANRSSLWSRYSTGWRIRFHQGTAV
jgi:hypothetical protein